MHQKTTLRKSEAPPITAALPTSTANTLLLQVSNTARTQPTDANQSSLRQSLHKYNNSCDPSPVCGTAHNGQRYRHYKPAPEFQWLSHDNPAIARSATDPTAPLQYTNLLQISRHCDSAKNCCRSTVYAASPRTVPHATIQLRAKTMQLQ